MNRVKKVLSYTAFVVAFCFLAIGYAAVQDTLTISGTISLFDKNAIYCVATTEKTGDVDEDGNELLRLRIYQRKFNELPIADQWFDETTNSSENEAAEGRYLVSGVYSWPSGVDTEKEYRTVSAPSWRTEELMTEKILNSSGNITEAYFDQFCEVIAVDELEPTSLKSWFDGYRTCTRFDLDLIVTSNTKTMEKMFYNCKALVNENSANDYLKFEVNAVKATSLKEMFYGCSALKSLSNVSFSSAENSVLTNVEGMFCSCTSLESINLTNLHFSSSSAVTFNKMFSWCQKLQTVNLTSKPVTAVNQSSGINNMFYQCNVLQTIDLSFLQCDLRKGDSTFQLCKTLRTIYVSSKAIPPSTANMFVNCTSSLKGGAGSTYDGLHTNADYAWVDGINGRRGYFTAVVQPIMGDSWGNVVTYTDVDNNNDGRIDSVDIVVNGTFWRYTANNFSPGEEGQLLLYNNNGAPNDSGTVAEGSKYNDWVILSTLDGSLTSDPIKVDNGILTVPEQFMVQNGKFVIEKYQAEA